jgi:hypothetical protein
MGFGFLLPESNDADWRVYTMGTYNLMTFLGLENRMEGEEQKQ